MVEPAFAVFADDAYLHQAKELAQVGSALYGVWQGCEEMFSKLTTPLTPGNSTTFCVAGPTDPTDPSGLEPPRTPGATPHHGGSSSNPPQWRSAGKWRPQGQTVRSAVWFQPIMKQYANSVLNTQAEHRKYAAYDLLNLDPLFRRLLNVARCGDINFQGTPGPDAEYSAVSNTIYLAPNAKDNTAIHEGIHAIDDLSGINFTPLKFLNHNPWMPGPSPLDEAEGLAYVGTAIVGRTNSLASGLARFERTLGSNASNYDVTREWFLLWNAHSSPSNYTVIVPGEGSRPGEQRDMDCVTKNLGVRVDWMRMANFYSHFSQTQLGRKIWLPNPTQDSFDAHQENHFERINWRF